MIRSIRSSKLECPVGTNPDVYEPCQASFPNRARLIEHLKRSHCKGQDKGGNAMKRVNETAVNQWNDQWKRESWEDSEGWYYIHKRYWPESESHPYRYSMEDLRRDCAAASSTEESGARVATHILQLLNDRQKDGASITSGHLSSLITLFDTNNVAKSPIAWGTGPVTTAAASYNIGYAAGSTYRNEEPSTQYTDASWSLGLEGEQKSSDGTWSDSTDAAFANDDPTWAHQWR